ncbi:MAG: HipA domain-containing protein [Ruminococcus sp.]|nr:HipA domain-containing protein [Ruminococcus sp.]
MGLSLADRYRYRPAGSGLTWADVSCFDRDFDTGFGEAVLIRDYAALAKADPLTPDCTLGGVSRKAWIRMDGAPMLLKTEEGTSSFITQSELLSARLTERLLDKGDHVAYTKVGFAGKNYIACRSMVGDCEEFVPAHDVLCAMGLTDADSVKYISKDDELLAQFTKALTELGVENVGAYFAKIAAVFNLSLAGDCHLQNFGFIRDLNTMKLRSAPLFDMGRSFGSFGKSLENGRFSCAEYAIESARTMFVMMLFHSILIRSDWDFGRYEPARLEGFEDEMDSMLAVCTDIPKEYIEMLKEAFRYQLDYLNKAAGKA